MLIPFLISFGIVIGVVVVVLLVRNGRNGGGASVFLRRKQNRKQIERKEKIVKLAGRQEKITNNDVEHMLGVSDATATNYLQELEQEGVLEQVGAIGRGVFYRKK